MKKVKFLIFCHFLTLDNTGITESPTKSYGNIQEGIELRPNMIVVISIVVVLLVLLFIIALTATLWNHIRKTSEYSTLEYSYNLTGKLCKWLYFHLGNA